MTDEHDVKLMKVFIWRNPLRGEVAVAAKTEKEARAAILKENPNFAVLLSGGPLVVDPAIRGMVVHRWRRY